MSSFQLCFPGFTCTRIRAKPELLHDPTCQHPFSLNEEGFCISCMNIHNIQCHAKFGPIKSILDSNIEFWLHVLQKPHRNNVHIQKWARERHKVNTRLSKQADELLAELVELCKQLMKPQFDTGETLESTRDKRIALNDKVFEEQQWRHCCIRIEPLKAVLKSNINTWVAVRKMPQHTNAAMQKWALERHKVNTRLSESAEEVLAEWVNLRNPKGLPVDENALELNRGKFVALGDEVTREEGLRKDVVKSGQEFQRSRGKKNLKTLDRDGAGIEEVLPGFVSCGVWPKARKKKSPLARW